MKKEKSTKNKSESRSKPGIKPLGDRVLIKEIQGSDKVEKTAGGIFIPESVKEDRGSKKGEVIAVGPGRMDDGVTIPMTVKAGDTVLYSWGDTVKVGDTEYVVVSESNIIAVVR